MPGRKRKIDYRELARLYTEGLTLSELAVRFDVTEPAIHYALTKQGVARNRLDNPDKHSMNPEAVKSRYYRYSVELEKAVEAGVSAERLQIIVKKVQRELKNKARIRWEKLLQEVRDVSKFLDGE